MGAWLRVFFVFVFHLAARVRGGELLEHHDLVLGASLVVREEDEVEGGLAELVRQAV